MKKSLVPAVRSLAFVTSAVIALFSIFACAAHVSRSEYGTVKIAVGGGRGLETGWPLSSLPTFSSITVKVSASDMSPITVNTSASGGAVTIQVPAGSNRLVELTAVPASGSSAPYYAKAYAGSTTVDIDEGETETISLTLSLSETKIILPHHYAGTYSIHSANSLGGGLDAMSHSASLDGYADFELDGYGRLFYTDTIDNLLRISSPTDSGVLISASLAPAGLAYVSAQSLLYCPNGLSLDYIDVADETAGSIDMSGYATYGLNSAIAAEASAVYVDAYPSATRNLYKISLNGTTITDFLSVTYANLGLVIGAITLDIKDMIVKDGVLYIAASYVVTGYYSFDTHSCGKIIAVDTATMQKLWEVGWNGDQTPQNESSPLLYGPIRFVGIAPKKLYVADEGFYWSGVSGASVVNVDHVVEIDLAAQGISGSGLLNEVAFLADYSGVVWAC